MICGAIIRSLRLAKKLTPYFQTFEVYKKYSKTIYNQTSVDSIAFDNFYNIIMLPPIKYKIHPKMA